MKHLSVMLVLAIVPAAAAQMPARVGSVAGTASAGVGGAVGATVNGTRTATAPPPRQPAIAARTDRQVDRGSLPLVDNRPVPARPRRAMSGRLGLRSGVDAGLNVVGTTPDRGADTGVDAVVNATDPPRRR